MAEDWREKYRKRYEGICCEVCGKPVLECEAVHALVDSIADAESSGRVSRPAGKRHFYCEQHDRQPQTYIETKNGYFVCVPDDVMFLTLEEVQAGVGRAGAGLVWAEALLEATKGNVSLQLMGKIADMLAPEIVSRKRE